jgi:hypothetical protein
MRTLFLCLFLSLLPAVAPGQETCDPNNHCATPPISCPYSTPTCSESGYWVCGCTNPEVTTCYEASDCGGEDFSCLYNCCVDNAGCCGGACNTIYDCGGNPNDWVCIWGCCGSTNGGGNGGLFGSCQTDMDCPGCQGCSNGTCFDYNGYCSYGEVCVDGTCGDDQGDPIAIDLDGDAFALTDLRQGVTFDFLGTRKPQRISWTSAGSDVGWLAVDLNGDGRIDNGFEMFSNIAKQPGMPKGSNGFKALAQYDLPANGGNGDGIIDQRDKIFSRLRLWVDKNHNGISEPGELLTMQEAGIRSISLDYQLMQWTDAYGNKFQNRASIIRSNGGGGQWAYDVVLLMAK